MERQNYMEVIRMVKTLELNSIQFKDTLEITQRKGKVKFDVLMDDSGNEFVVDKEELLNFLQ